jgi:hypothetical protein
VASGVTRSGGMTSTRPLHRSFALAGTVDIDCPTPYREVRFLNARAPDAASVQPLKIRKKLFRHKTLLLLDWHGCSAGSASIRCLVELTKNAS